MKGAGEERMVAMVARASVWVGESAGNELMASVAAWLSVSIGGGWIR